jgi:hypothetical protein
MIRTIVLALLVGICLAGCARSMPAGLAGSVRAVHGERFSGASYSRDASSSGLKVELDSGEPTGTQPFAVLAAFVRAVPGMGRYQVTYWVSAPHPGVPEYQRLYGYEWQPARQTVTWWVGTFTGGSVYSLDLEGSASQVNTATLAAVAARKRAVPVFGKQRPVDRIVEPAHPADGGQR